MNDDKYSIDLSGTITIDLNNTYGATTSYSYGEIPKDPVTGDIYFDNNGNMNTYNGSEWTNITITDNSYTISGSSTNWNVNDTIDISSILNGLDTKIYNEEEIENMCKVYPGLDKAWSNFKSVYDMVKQDYEGKKRAGELDE